MGTTIPLSNPNITPFPLSSRRKPPHIIPKNRRSILSVLAPPTSVTFNDDDDDHILKIHTTYNNTTATTLKTTVYHDNWFETLAIDYISKAVQETSGLRNDKRGYNGFVAVTSAIFRKFNTIRQRQIVLKTLENAIPGFILIMIRKLMPDSKFTREFFTLFTVVFFRWLIGPSEVRESEFEGKKQRNVVHISKCRFLEEANCVGMCTNLCKIPTQEFINKNLGTPVNLVPNFDDMSCEIIFGQEPPLEEDDPAFKQPCYKLCHAKQRHSASCII